MPFRAMPTKEISQSVNCRKCVWLCPLVARKVEKFKLWNQNTDSDFNTCKFLG
uniref:Uncharacterized protein n=1 Tax=Megaselia scalaris TaxID=36166 RepID=T1GEP6_MEGSC